MKHLFELDNYDSLHALHLGLQQSLIQQLTSTWLLIEESAQNFYKKIVDLFDHRMNFKSYREKLDKISPRVPCIPVQSLTLRDLTFVQENATLLKNGSINMKKMDLIHKILRDATKYKEVIYNIEEDVVVQHLITSRIIASEKELYALAKDMLQKEKKKADLAKEKERKQQEKFRKVTRSKLERNKIPTQFEYLVPPNPNYTLFYSWLLENLGTECIDFYNKVNDWEATNWQSEEARIQSTKSIFNEYKGTVGVSSNLWEDVEKNLETRDVFQEIKAEVLEELQTRYEEWYAQIL